MNVVREINKINERELDLGISGSWHDDYKDSAYIFIGGLNYELTEGDVITIFSQYGEVMDVNLPRDKDTGKTKGFGFLMYEDQRSTVLAVDNLNGATVLERTLRVDHVKNYKQPKQMGEDGEWVEAEVQSFNAKPEMVVGDNAESDSSEDDGPPIDPEDPMYDYLVQKRKEERAARKAKKGKSKQKSKKHKDETPEERRARKERKKLKKTMGKSEGMRGVEELLSTLMDKPGDHGRDRGDDTRRQRSPLPDRDYDTRMRSRTPPRRLRDDDDRGTSFRSSDRRRSVSPDRTSGRDRTSYRRASRSPGAGFHGDRRATASGFDSVNDRGSHSRGHAPSARRRGE